MAQTALQQQIEMLKYVMKKHEEKMNHKDNKALKRCLDALILDLEDALPLEREQIERAFYEGYTDAMRKQDKYDSASDYFEKTYNDK